MGAICEHQLKQGVEYDLYAKLDMTIRWKNERFEIARISDPSVVVFWSKELENVVKRANELEGGPNTDIECGKFCPME